MLMFRSYNVYHVHHLEQWRQSQEVTKVSRIHHLETMNAGTKFHGNPSHSCPDISVRTKNVTLLLALKEKSQDHQSHWNRPFIRTLKAFMGIPPVDV